MTLTKKAASLALLAGYAAAGHAAEGFEPRYNLAGSLGGEIFAPPDQTGWAFVAAATRVPVPRVSGDDGKDLRLALPGSTLNVPGLPPGLQPSYSSGKVTVEGNGAMTRTDIALAYLTKEEYGGGRLAFALDLPLIRKDQHIALQGATPALNWPGPVPPPVQSGVTSQFDSQYQAGLSAQSAASSGKVHGVGDAELMAGWQFVGDRWRVLAGTSLILPSGKYSTDPKPDAGTGNFRTLRPALQIGYLPTPRIALGAKVSLGLNTRNHDNQLRSGNWFGVEVAAGYMTPIGVVGVHALRVQQYQDDDGNPFGPSRFRSTNAGAFFTTKIPGIDSVLTLQYIDTTSSRHAKHGSFTQLRLIKLL
ncbi:transporter [Pseudoduganella violaceinigra]|uniref:transporter n=1 Tax=Pseudoduganella violaceinigra TaxID=246602 RepID=UPI0004073FB2|nr:transporter [Pseudoduganella violaceinigra]